MLNKNIKRFYYGEKRKNEIPLAPENAFFIIFLLILIPLLLTGFLSQ